MGVFCLKNLYNKHKSHIIYSIKPKFKKIVLLLLLMIFNITFWFTFKNVDQNFKPTVTALATSYSSTYTLSMINESIRELNLPESIYSDICKINKNENSEIVSITTKTSNINKIKLNLSERIIKRINTSDSTELGVPIGNLTNMYIFSGRGPKIPIKLTSASSPEIKVENKFESAGINQTKHKISLLTTVNIQIVLPYETLTKQVGAETLICETIIVGKVPDVYISK